MKRLNWLDLSRKLVTRFDLDYSMNSMQEYWAKLWKVLVGQGSVNSYTHGSPFVMTPSNSDLTVGVGAGIAYDSIGQMIEVASSTSITLAPNPSSAIWGLIVLRWRYVGNTLIPKPSDPLTNVYEYLVDSYAMEFIPGTSGVYPTKDARDVVLVGVKLPAAATVATQAVFDYSVSELAYQAVDTMDNRLRPFKAGNKIFGIQPSQTYGGTNAPKRFTFLGVNRPSIYPKSYLGTFNPQPSFVNLENMALSGGDEASSMPTPIIPAGGSAIVATISVKPDDTLDISYGSAGTYTQCKSGIQNQVYTGAGSLAPFQPFFIVAYVIISSTDGLTVSDIDITDARPYGQVATISAMKVERPTGVIDGVNTAFHLSTIPVATGGLLVLVDGIALPTLAFTVSGTLITLTDAPQLGQDIMVVYLINAVGSFGTIGSGSGGGSGTGTPRAVYRTLSAQDVANKYIVLPNIVPQPTSVLLDGIGGTTQEYGVDFQVSGNTLSWSGLGLDGQLTTGDKLRVFYIY